MLGTIGFTAAALAFGLYGYSSYKLAAGSKFNGRDYLIGYLLAAAACLVWGVSIQLTDVLLQWVLLGDALLLVAIAFLLNTVAARKMTLLYSLSIIVLLFGLLYLRIAGTDAEPVVRNGVLIFNTPRVFGALLAVVLLVIWVKANMNFYNSVVSVKFPNVLRSSYFSMNILGFISVTAFLLARKDMTVIIAFTLLVTSFVMLAALNYYVSNTGRRKELSHAR